ncbi:lytic transglycosylase domain-containing protein [Sphingomonas sabuli]|uniref:Lytic transglycosylase domain-containing protein n=1 Tax=Sphingomonas sabuli TaxID=2764186 RepID=A0A7G9KZB8_9SPHN|nr:lytic transglycosylase domain-containing protein [Sphingomonas sabuli]QNM81717.1 lytic transglycosylase domain-containing protein [Sphingomonas sabuli]
MMLKTFLCAFLPVLVLPVAAQAQVIEIDSSGEATTFDQPTVFTAETPAPIVVEERRAASGAAPHLLLAEAARAHGLDQHLLESVAWQESRGRVDAVSVKGARGVMQLMPGTAAQLGVRIDDPADNIRGGAKYLRQQLDRFGSVPLALAAYNAGPGAVLRYGGIPPYAETRDYVSKIMKRWGSAFSKAAVQQPVKEVQQP